MNTDEAVDGGQGGGEGGERVKRDNISARDRLLQLGTVFTLNQMATLCDTTSGQAAVYASRWASKGLITLAGPKAGIYYNLVRNLNAASEERHRALLQAHPTAVVRAESVLHAAGWTTQVPPTVTVASMRPTPTLDGFTIVARTQEWMAAMRPWYAAEPLYGLPALTPAMALAELHAANEPDAWRPDVDDLDEVTLGDAAADVIVAFAALDLEVPAAYCEVLAATPAPAVSSGRRRP